VIIASWVELEESKVQHHQPRVVRVDSSNRITGTEQEIPGPSQPYDSRMPSFE
jgi:aspartate 1-decarboxylase